MARTIIWAIEDFCITIQDCWLALKTGNPDLAISILRARGLPLDDDIPG